jgi:hypothetical protein
MKYLLLTLFLHVSPFWLTAQENKEESLGLPGDNLNLYAALKLFQECETLEVFEKKLNSEDDKINNLDLDEDGNIDYVKVVDSVDNGVHNIVLQVDLGQGETQNVAVFMVKKEKDGATIQVIGDEDLYGKDYIIEPNYDDKGTPNPGFQGNQVVTVPANASQYQQQTVTYVHVYSWPVVRYIYHVNYRPWRSPWYWGYYPGWWRPWKPYYWHYYYGYHYHWNYYYYGYYRRGYWYRYSGWHGWYYGSPWRRRSNVYYNNYRAGNYRKTYSRPETLNDGSASFKTRFPTAPSANNKLPNVKVPEFKPDLVKPAVTPESKPGTKPTPGTKPVSEAKPGTRPTPGTKPTTGVNPPVTTRPTPKPPVAKPAPKPTPKPAVTKPAPKPAPKPTPKPVPKPAPTTTRG